MQLVASRKKVATIVFTLRSICWSPPPLFSRCVASLTPTAKPQKLNAFLLTLVSAYVLQNQWPCQAKSDWRNPIGLEQSISNSSILRGMRRVFVGQPSRLSSSAYPDDPAVSGCQGH